MKLSVLMPVYNEASTTAEAVKSVRNVDYPCEMELFIVDDGSTDRTREILAGFRHEHIVGCRHASNRGKGAAIRTAAQAATGDYIIICDADTRVSDLETCFKRLTWRDGVEALWILAKARVGST